MLSEKSKEDILQNKNAEVQEFIHQLIESTGSNLFVTGKAGSGKTYFLRKESKRTTKRHVILAPTGIAAVNAGGVTINSLFQIPPGTFLPQKAKQGSEVYAISDILENLSYSRIKRTFLRSLELVFIDEVSMLRSDQLSLIDAILKKTRNSTLPFGGIQMVFIGDLFQLPPVLPNELAKVYRAHYKSEFFFDSDVIRSNPLVQIELPFIHRQSDKTFINLLNRTRTNQLTDDDLTTLNDKVNDKDDEHFAIQITSHIESATQLNNDKLASLAGDEHQYPAIITGDFKDGNTSAERVLKLKIGAQVMIIRNDTKSLKDYFNGKTGEITRLEADTITVRFEDAKEIEIERVTWQSIDYLSTAADGQSVIGELKQFPIKLAWAVTIHKSQGLTFERAVVDAAKSFAPGQVYVALSRVRSFDGLRLKTELTKESVRTNPIVSEYLNLTPAADFERVLEDSKTRFWLHQLLNQFDVSTEHEEITEFLSKPNTYKQKIDTSIVISFQDADEALKKLKTVWNKFFIDTMNRFYPNIDPIQLDERINKGIEFFTNALISITTQIKDKAVGKNELSVSLVDKVSTSLNGRVQEIAKARLWVNLFSSRGIGFAIEEGRKKDRDVLSPTVEPTGSAKKRTAINSGRQTVELFLAGNTIDEISKVRNLSSATVEKHLLEAERNGQSIATAALKEGDLLSIQNRIDEIGVGVIDLKEFFGDKYTFFQIHLAIAHSQRVSETR